MFLKCVAWLGNIEMMAHSASEELHPLQIRQSLYSFPHILHFPFLLPIPNILFSNYENIDISVSAKISEIRVVKSDKYSTHITSIIARPHPTTPISQNTLHPAVLSNPQG
jgi:hypothetical protein